MNYVRVNLILLCAALSAAVACGGASQTVTATQTPPGGGSVTQSQLAVNPSTINFGSLQVGATLWKSVQLTNSGGNTVTISSASTTGPGFRISGLSLPADIGPGQSLAFNVGFNPSSSGAASGSVQLTNNGATSPVSIALSGTGVAAIAHEVTASWDSCLPPVLGYNVYRAGTAGGPYARVNSTLVATTSYTDTTVSSGSTYYYVVTSVSANNAESKYSSEARATVPTP